ncbi:MAG: U32 family peptidase [Methanosarcinales archaeon]|nr:U32 family peptidase [Methanosarcinales archaeon]
MKKKLYVPHPGHFEGLAQLLASSKDIYSIYMAGSPDYIGTGRVNLGHASLEEIAKHTQYCHNKGVKIEMVLNSSCMGGQQLTTEGYNLLHWYLSNLEDIGVDTVVVADPYLVEMLDQEFNIPSVVSVLAFVDSPQKAEFYEQLGASSIVVDSNVNRHFDVLEAIKDAVDCELKLLVNEGCLYRCPFRYAHFNFFSHVNGPPPRPNVQDDYYYYKCLTMRINDPSLIIKSPFIRPEDLEEYAHITDVFKIGGRSHLLNWILNCVDAYANESYDGNLMDLMDCPKDLIDLFNIPNKALDGAIQQWKTHSTVCHTCGYCQRLSDKVTQMYSRMGTPDEKLEQWTTLTKKGIDTL